MVLNRLLGKNEELTLIFIKPDAMRSSDVGEICSMLSRKNPYFAGARLVSMSKELCLEHYDTAFKDWKKDNKTEDEPPFKESVLRYMLGLHHYTDDDPARGRVLAVAFHGNDIIKKVKDAISIPVAGNGDILDPISAKNMFDYTGCDSIMVARGAIGNPTIFNEIKHYLKTGKIKKPIKKSVVFKRYLRYAKKYNIDFARIKAHVQWMTKGVVGGSKMRVKINNSKSVEEIKDLFSKTT